MFWWWNGKIWIKYTRKYFDDRLPGTSGLKYFKIGYNPNHHNIKP